MTSTMSTLLLFFVTQKIFFPVPKLQGRKLQIHFSATGVVYMFVYRLSKQFGRIKDNSNKRRHNRTLSLSQQVLYPLLLFFIPPLSSWGFLDMLTNWTQIDTHNIIEIFHSSFGNNPLVFITVSFRYMCCKNFCLLWDVKAINWNS